MSYLLFLCSIAMFMLYISLKYSAYRTFFSKRPTSKELWEYAFENNISRGRNAVAFKYVGIFLFVIGILCLPATPSLLTELRNKSFVITFLKMLLLIMLGLNFMARHVIYEEDIKSDKQFSIPLLEIFDALKRAPWFVRGTDFISYVVNMSTIAVAVIFISLIYTLFFNF